MRRFFKLLGGLLAILGIGVLYLDGSKGAEIPLLVGLFIVLVSREQIEDERVKSLKATSVYMALMAGYGFKLISTNLYEHRVD